MARTSAYTCKTCGKIYEFCLKCQVSRPNYDAENFCSQAHANIFAILSKHGCNLATAEETLEALKDYDVTNVTEAIQSHIDSLKSETTPKVEVPTEVIDTVVEEVIEKPTDTSVEKQSNKNNKKKW